MRSSAVLLAFLLVGLAAVLPGCKKPKPSPEFDEASTLHSKLYAEKLDDAYLDPQMGRVEELLAAVPGDSLDAKAAAELLAKVRSERKRVTEEEEARKKAVAEALKPAPMPPSQSASSPPVTAVEARGGDAGTSEDQPAPGMSADVFRSRFSGCFEVGPQVKVIGEGWADTWELKNIANCRDRHPEYVHSVVAIKDGKVYSRFLKSEIKSVVTSADGGEAREGR